jgi:hypothetical protein
MMLAGWRSDDLLSRCAVSTAVERAHDAHRRLALRDRLRAGSTSEVRALRYLERSRRTIEDRRERCQVPRLVLSVSSRLPVGYPPSMPSAEHRCPYRHFSS